MLQPPSTRRLSPTQGTPTSWFTSPRPAHPLDSEQLLPQGPPPFNRNTVKIVYITTAKMATVILRYNKQVIKESQKEPPVKKEEKQCDCNKASLPCVMGANVLKEVL